MRLRGDRKVARREEATERNAAWAKLSTTEKTLSLSQRRGKRAKQMKRLSKLETK